MIHEVIERVQFENESIKVCDTVLNTYTKPQPHVLANPCIEYKRPASLPQSSASPSAANLSLSQFQAVMEGQLEKKADRSYGPPGAQQLVYFVDDLNMPQLDEYDTSTAVSLFRQYFEYQHWYDPSKLQLRVIQNCQFIIAMNPTCGSFIINPRLQRHFMVFAIGFPGQEALMTIFSTFLNGHVKDFDPKLSDVVFQNKVIQAALELHDKVSKQFRPPLSDPTIFTTPDKFAAWKFRSESWQRSFGIVSIFTTSDKFFYNAR